MPRMLISLLFCLLSFSFPIATQAQQGSTAAPKTVSVQEYFKMKVGTIRVYADINGEQVRTVTVTTVMSRYVGDELVTAHEVDISGKKQLFFETATQTKAWRGGLRTSGLYALVGPVKVGTTWAPAPGTSFQIETVGKVKTTSGTYDGVVVRYKTARASFAKGLGLVRLTAVRKVGDMEVEEVNLDLIRVQTP